METVMALGLPLPAGAGTPSTGNLAAVFPEWDSSLPIRRQVKMTLGLEMTIDGKTHSYRVRG